MLRLVFAIGLLTSRALAAAAGFSPAETLAIYNAAGFTMRGKAIVGCDAADPGWPRSDISIDAIDLNGDGKPEVIVNEGNSACYGSTGNGFTVLAKSPAGQWRRLGKAVGMPGPLQTRHAGWLDIEIGGPGFGRMPVLRFDGTAYK